MLFKCGLTISTWSISASRQRIDKLVLHPRISQRGIDVFWDPLEAFNKVQVVSPRRYGKLERLDEFCSVGFEHSVSAKNHL